MLEFRQARKLYESPGEPIRAVDNVDLIVEPGEFVAIFGPSGSGKSTLLKLAGGLLRPDSGAIYFEGRDLAALRKRDVLFYRRIEIGLISQSFDLLEGLSAEDNVTVPLLVRKVAREEAKTRARAALEAVGVLHRSTHTPDHLSGGEQQRVALARALVGRPRLVLADEPTGNLDSDTSEAVLQLLNGLAREHGVTLLLATHDARAARFADRVLQMRNGRLVESEHAAAW